MGVKLLIVFFGMLWGGLVAQSFKFEPDYWLVADHAFWQGWALLTYWFMERFIWKGEAQW